MDIKIVNDYPPNIDQIRTFLNAPEENIFCYGNHIYVPSGKEIPPDIIEHERIHAHRQTEGLQTPQTWWNRYLTDKEFRKEEELIAYAHQYNFIKETYPHKAHQEALFELAKNLRDLYNLVISLPEAESKIRNKAKELS